MARITAAQRSGGDAKAGHWATNYWSRRKLQKGLGIAVSQGDLTEFEAAILEYCEGTYGTMMKVRGGKR